MGEMPFLPQSPFPWPACLAAHAPSTFRPDAPVGDHKDHAVADYATLENLRKNHPAWRLLCAQHAPLIISFLHRVFIVPNMRTISQADLVEALEDELFALREQYGEAAFPGGALDYLNAWAENGRGWLRKFYPQGTDEPHFDLTPATEKAISWVTGLTERAFVGTESRLLTLFELLRQMDQGTQLDPEVRKAELVRRREELDRQIAELEEGRVDLLDDTGLKERFAQFQQLARELLADFREVEHKFRMLDRSIRERIARGDEGKGILLEKIMGERDAIADSDQGKSFRAFWDFLMSQSRQEEFTTLLRRVLSLKTIADMHPEPRLARVHYDWLEAGEHTQRTVAKLSEQLRRFLDDQAWLENRRIMHILQSIETRALAVRDDMPRERGFMPLDDTTATVDLPLERPLYTPPARVELAEVELEEGIAEGDASALFDQVFVDLARLRANIREVLRDEEQASLGHIIALHPLRHGLAELVAYLQIAGQWPKVAVDEETREEVRWPVEPEQEEPSSCANASSAPCKAGQTHSAPDPATDFGTDSGPDAAPGSGSTPACHPGPEAASGSTRDLPLGIGPRIERRAHIPRIVLGRP